MEEFAEKQISLILEKIRNVNPTIYDTVAPSFITEQNLARAKQIIVELLEDREKENQ